jgi:hypothetical protein
MFWEEIENGLRQTATNTNCAYKQINQAVFYNNFCRTCIRFLPLQRLVLKAYLQRQ